MPHPYEPKQEKQTDPHYAPADFGDWKQAVNQAVQYGTQLGGEILGTISDALQESIDAMRQTRPQAQPNVDRVRRQLDRKLAGSFGGYLAMSIIGWIFAGSFLIATITMAALSGAAPMSPGNLLEYKSVFDILATVFAPVTVGFGIMGWVGAHCARYFGRLRRYVRVVRGWTAELPQLTRDSVTPAKRVQKDLLKAAAAGHLPGAYYDPETQVFYLDETRYSPPQPASPTQEPEAAAPLTEAELFERQGAEFLHYLRGCHGVLSPDADEELTTMQRTCSAILGFIHNHPDQITRVRRFAQYYLPTTRKLLDTALGLGGAQVDNAAAIRRDITGILHTLNIAYERLYDTLLQEVSLDVSAEIDTLEAMLHQDGLKGDFASDFGTGPAR